MPPSGFIYHKVVPGDTVSGLARRYGVSQQAIIAANGLKPPYTIYVGHTLLISHPASHRRRHRPLAKRHTWCSQVIP